MSGLMKVISVSLRTSKPGLTVPVCCRLCSSKPDASDRKRWSNIREKHKKRYPYGWNPHKKLTRYQMDYMRTLKREQPEEWNVTKLASSFGVSPAAVVRILKSKFEPTAAVQERQDKRALELRDRRRQMAMDSGDRPKMYVQPEHKKPDDKDLVIDFDT